VGCSLVALKLLNRLGIAWKLLPKVETGQLRSSNSLSNRNTDLIRLNSFCGETESMRKRRDRESNRLRRIFKRGTKPVTPQAGIFMSIEESTFSLPCNDVRHQNCSAANCQFLWQL